MRIVWNRKRVRNQSRVVRTIQSWYRDRRVNRLTMQILEAIRTSNGEGAKYFPTDCGDIRCRFDGSTTKLEWHEFTVGSRQWTLMRDHFNYEFNFDLIFWDIRKLFKECF